MWRQQFHLAQIGTLGVTVATIYSTNSESRAAIFRRIMVFPPLLALIAAFALIPFEFSDWVSEALKRLGDTLAPLALVSVGLQLRFDQTKGIESALATGLGFKLLLAPAVLALLYSGILGRTEEITRVTLFEAAMGPQIGGCDCRDSTWPQPAAGFPDGWPGLFSLVLDAAVMVICLASVVDTWPPPLWPPARSRA